MPSYEIELHWECPNCPSLVGGLKSACDGKHVAQKLSTQ
jgi:hypothetical protein